MATPSQTPVTNALVCFKLSVSLSYLKFYCNFLWCGIFLEEVCIREGFKNSWCNRLRIQCLAVHFTPLIDFIHSVIEWQEGMSICALAVAIHTLVLLIN